MTVSFNGLIQGKKNPLCMFFFLFFFYSFSVMMARILILLLNVTMMTVGLTLKLLLE